MRVEKETEAALPPKQLFSSFASSSDSLTDLLQSVSIFRCTTGEAFQRGGTQKEEESGTCCGRCNDALLSH